MTTLTDNTDLVALIATHTDLVDAMVHTPDMYHALVYVDTTVLHELGYEVQAMKWYSSYVDGWYYYTNDVNGKNAILLTDDSMIENVLGIITAYQG